MESRKAAARYRRGNDDRSSSLRSDTSGARESTAADSYVPRGPLRYGRADQALLALASRQHGVVTRAQVLDMGISVGVLDRRVRTPLLHCLHRGVYQVGPILVPKGRALAAVFACGPHAWVSHVTASALWRSQPGRDGRRPRREIFLAGEDSDTVDVTTTRGDHRRRGIRVHRVRSLAPDEVTTLERIPITTPARTLLDLAASLPSRDLERVLVESLAARRTTRDDVLMLTNRYPRQAGSARLRALLEADEPALTRSGAEDAFLSLIKDVRLPTPKVNVKVEGFEVDFLWPAAKLVVEIDGRAYHSTRDRVASDKRKDFALAVAGYRVIRFTADQVVDEPNLVQVQVAQALARPPLP